jgi:hypothetical protein
MGGVRVRGREAGDNAATCCRGTVHGVVWTCNVVVCISQAQRTQAVPCTWTLSTPGCIQAHPQHPHPCSPPTPTHPHPPCSPALKLLTSKTNLSSLKLDFIPWLSRHCLKATAAAAAAAAAGGNERALWFGGSGLNPSLSPAELALARHGSGFLLAGAGGSGSFTNIAAAAAAAASGDGGSSGAAAVAGSSGGAAAGSSSGHAAAPAAAASSTTGSMAGDYGEGTESWVADVGMGLPGVLTGTGLPGEGYMALSHAGAAAAAAASRAGRVGVHLVPPGRYCGRVNTVAAFGEVNRDVSELCLIVGVGWMGGG